MKKLWIAVPLAVVAGLGVWQQRHFDQQMEASHAERAAMAEQLQSMQARLDSLPAEVQTKVARAEADLAVAEMRLNAMAARASALETQLMSFQARGPRLVSSRTFIPDIETRTVSGYTNDANGNPVFNAVFPKRGRWGPEELTGPPDTQGSGDITTAWAARRPDGGQEWLKLEYENATSIAEVHIRETYNPGAVSKVTAFMPDGTEVLLWEGTAVPTQAPNDFVVPVNQNVSASQIKVYLDTQRVSGWNEIDAVEMVGRDGSRQWAKNASASSTFAETQPVERER